MSKLQKLSLIAISTLFICTGILHFVLDDYLRMIMPPFIPAKMFLIYLSGTIEIILGLLIYIPRIRSTVAWLLICLLVAVFPANIYMYTASDKFSAIPDILLLLRLPLQFLLIYWVYTFTNAARK